MEANSNDDSSVDRMQLNAKRKVEQLEKRYEERIENRRNKKDEDVERASKMASDEYFALHFKEECDILKEKINDESISCNHDRAEVAKYLEDLSESYEKLLKFLNDSTMFLLAFQLERAQKILNEIQSEILKKKEILAPRKKFAFKAKKKVSNAPKENNTKSTSAKVPSAINLSASQCQISSKTGETIELNHQNINGNDVALSKLHDCVVKMQGYPGTVHISDVQNCTILCGPVSGSVFVEKCTSSRIVTGCQQLRVHDTTASDFYLHVTSRAIIEDSKELRFAPFNWFYLKFEEDLVASGLKKGINNWDNIDDFNWLSSEEKSPNWCVMPESDRENDWSKYT